MEESSFSLPPKPPKFKKLLQMSQANKHEIRSLDKEYTPIFSQTESFKSSTPFKPVLQHPSPTTPMARPSTQMLYEHRRVMTQADPDKRLNKGLTRSLGKLSDYKPETEFHMVSLGSLMPVPKIRPQPHPLTLAGSPLR